jgi:hypothetical protein
MVWYCFERHVPIRFLRGGWKLPWITGELSCLKNKETKVAKRSKVSETRCLEVKTIDDCECEHLRGEFLLLREEYPYVFSYVDLKKKRAGYPRLCISKVVWHLVLITSAIFLLILYNEQYADDTWVPSDPERDLVQDDPPFGALQFTVDEVQSVLLELDVSKGAGPDGIPPLILKKCSSF